MRPCYPGLVLTFALFSNLAKLPAATPVFQIATIAGSNWVGDGGIAASAQVAQPEGIAIDAAGNIYIADAANHRIRMVTPAGTIITIAGNGHPGFTGDNGPANAAQLNQPYDLAFDPSGNLYVADYGNGRVRVIGADGNISTFAGGGTGGDGAPATAALLVGPRNLAADTAGNIYISEFGAHRVRRVATDGSISTVAGTGVAGLSGDAGLATAAQLAFPAGLGLDAAQNLYIVDSGNVRIRKVLSATGTISTICTQQSFGMPDIQLSGLAATAAGAVYIPEKTNGFVWLLAPGGTLSRIAGAAGTAASPADGQPALETALNAPAAVALDPAGDLYLSEAHRVRCVPATTAIAYTVAGTGSFGYAGDGGSAAQAVLNGPTGLAWNSGAIWISDTSNNRIRVAASGGAISTLAGIGTPAFAGDGLPASSAGLNSPAGLAFDPSGNLYVADSQNNRVRQITPTGTIATYAGDGSVIGFGGEDDPATSIPLDAPQSVAADGYGNVYLADTGHHRVIRIDSQGGIHTIAGTGTPGSSPAQLNSPAGLALDAAGNLFIADTANHRILLLAPGSGISVVAGTGAAGFSGDTGPAAAAQLNYPAAVAVDSGENIYISDTGNNRVRLVTPDGNIATVAGAGTAGYNGDTGLALAIALDNPSALAFDDQGGILVADTGNNRIRILTVTQAVVAPAQIPVTLANSASMAAGPLAPGEIFSIFSSSGGLGPATAAMGSYDANGMLSTAIGGVQVMFGNIAAPLFYVQANQINAQVPFEVAGQASAQLTVVYQGATVAGSTVTLADTSPALFTLNYGTGNAVAVNADGSINSDTNPAARGSIVTLYATGQGQTWPAGVTGQAAGLPYPSPVEHLSLTIGGFPSNILFAGDAPGFVGLLQIDAQIPSGLVPPGDLPVLLTIGANQSPAGVTIAVH